MAIADKPPIPPSVPGETWTLEGVDHLVAGDVVRVRERTKLWDRKRPMLRPGHFQPVEVVDERGRRVHAYGWRTLRGVVEDVDAVLSPTPGNPAPGAHRGFERRVTYRVESAEGVELPEIGSSRTVMQRTVQAKQGKVVSRITERLAGSGPVDRTDDWRARADAQADNVAAWGGDLRQRLAERAKAHERPVAEVVGMTHPEWIGDGAETDLARVAYGADVWSGREALSDEHRARLERWIDGATPKPVFADDGENDGFMF